MYKIPLWRELLSNLTGIDFWEEKSKFSIQDLSFLQESKKLQERKDFTLFFFLKIVDFKVQEFSVGSKISDFLI